MKKTISLLLVLIMTLSLVACGSSDNINDMVGDYKLYSMVENGKKYDAEELKGLEGLGLKVTFKVNKDSTAELNLMGTKTKLKIDTNKHTLSKGKQSLKYSYKDGIIKWSDKNSKTVLEFKKK